MPLTSHVAQALEQLCFMVTYSLSMLKTEQPKDKLNKIKKNNILFLEQKVTEPLYRIQILQQRLQS